MLQTNFEIKFGTKFLKVAFEIKCFDLLKVGHENEIYKNQFVWKLFKLVRLKESDRSVLN